MDVNAKKMDTLPEKNANAGTLEHRSLDDNRAGMYALGLNGDTPESLEFYCPCGCGALTTIPISAETRADAYQYDGNAEAPTIVPAFNSESPCGSRWHLTKGVFQGERRA